MRKQGNKETQKERKWKKWLNYKFDGYITRGFRAQFVLLFIVILFIVLIFGIIAGLLSSDLSLGKAIWQSLMHILDQGTITGDETVDFGYIVIMLIVTFLGMAFTGTIVGIINNAISEKLDALKKGHSQIIETGHIVIIGFDENIYTLISQMEESNRNWTGNKKIVIVDNMPKEDMEHFVKEHDQSMRPVGEDGYIRNKKKKNRNIIFRSGSIVSENTYTMASIEKARAIIINDDDDFNVIRVMLAVVSYLKKHNAYDSETMPAIVSLMHEKENITAAEIAAGVEPDSASKIGKSDNTKVRVLYFEDILAHIFAQVCRQPGLSWVISEIFNYENAEIYIEAVKRSGEILEKDFIGKSFGEISEMMKNSIAIGIQRDTEIILNPNPRTEIFKAGDKIIHLAEDDNRIELISDIDKEKIYVNVKQKEEETKPYNLLVFGWSVPLPEIIHEIDDYAVGGGTVRILTRHKSEDEATTVCPYYKKRRSKKAKRGVDDIGELIHLKRIHEDPIDPYDWENVKAHLEQEGVWTDPQKMPTDILILCQDGIDRIEADERAAVLLLNIRHYLSEKKLDKEINITTEMNLPENQVLLQHTSVNDFIVGSEIANRMMVQVANNTCIYSIFTELLNDDGAEIYLKDLKEYVTDINGEFSFKDIERAARSRVDLPGESKQEIALGWIKFGDNIEKPEVVLNPTGDCRTKKFPEKIQGENIKIVVLANNQSTIQVLRKMVSDNSIEALRKLLDESNMVTDKYTRHLMKKAEKEEKTDIYNMLYEYAIRHGFIKK